MKIKLYNIFLKLVRRSLLLITFLFIFIHMLFSEESKGENKECFGSVNRLQYIGALNKDEKVFTQGSFIILPKGFSLAESIELNTDVNNPNNNFDKFYLTLSISRYFSTDSALGKTFSWVFRVQDSSEINSILAEGLQWNISETQIFKKNTSKILWKSLLQVFIKNDNQLGRIDIFHWYQFPILANSRLYIRGTNTCYFTSDGKNCYAFMQDLIFPILNLTKIEIFLRYFYQNKENFLGRNEGSEISLGFRFSY